MSNRIVLAHPFGNANVRQALMAFHDADILEKFITTICAERIPLRGVLPKSIQTEIARRTFSHLPKSYIESHPVCEGCRLLGQRISRVLPRLTNVFPTADDIWDSTDRFLDASVRGRDSEALTIYAYEDGASRTFSSAKRSKKAYELPIGYWKSMHSILEEERELIPEWAMTLTGLKDPVAKLEKKDLELELADQIIVPSEFVAGTLPDSYRHKTTTIPYGCPVPINQDEIAHCSKGALKVLFCGSLGQRKGISYFFDAVERMGRSLEVIVVGKEVVNCPALTRSLNGVTWHRSLPHHRLLELMRQCDVLVFPTLFEGRALVVLEALSQGVPVITTANSGAEDVVINGKSGFIVPIRSVEAICNALELLYLDRHMLSYMKVEALKISAMSDWTGYRRKLVDAVFTM